MKSLQSLRQAWRLLTHEPLGILLPAAGLLLLEVLAGIVLGQAYGGWSWRGLAGLYLGLRALRLLLGAPLRALLIATGARVAGYPCRVWSRVPALLLVLGVEALVAALLAALPVALALTLASAAIVEGWFATGTILIAVAGVSGALVVFAVRVALANAPIEVVLGGRGAPHALRRALHARGPHEAAAILFVGDLAVAVGGLFCGAGALPGYPLSDLALISRWLRTQEAA